MKNNLKYSIVIRTHNHKELLGELLKKIKKQKKVLKPEIVIIDSSSTDGTQELAIKKGCKIFQINSLNFTHAHTFNLGAEKSKNELIVYASVDIIPKNDFWLFHLLKHFKNKKVGGVFGKQEPIRGLNPIEEFKIKKFFPDNEKSVARFSNASGVIRKSVWKKLRYNESVPFQYIGGEDQIWATKAKKKGYKIIYEPKSIVYHSHKYLLKIRLKGAYELELNKHKFDEWNKNVFILNYNKIDLIIYLLKKGAFKSLFFDLIWGGFLMRLYAIKGKIDRKNLI
jgi:rhamnosyltransferase